MNERRDYENNGFGWHQEERRRDYDHSLEAMCLHCDLRREVNSKVSWKLFILIIGGILTITGTFLGIASNAAINGAERMLDTSKATLEAIHVVGERTAKIEARQEILMNRVADIDNENHRSR